MYTVLQKIVVTWQRYTVITTLLSAAVFAIGLVHPLLWPLSLCAAAPFLVVMSKTDLDIYKRTLLGFLFFSLFLGWIFFAMFWHALPLTWALINPSYTQYGLVGAGWLITVLTVALSGAVFGCGIFYAHKSTLPLVLTVPSLWVCCEVCGALLLGLILYGEGTIPGAHLSIGFVGNTLADSPFLILSSIGGVFGLSFLVATSNTLCALLCMHPFHTVKKQLTWSTLIVLTFFSTAYILPHHSLTPVVVSAVNTQTPPLLPLTDAEEKIYKNSFDALVSSASGEFIALPEASEYLQRKRDTYTAHVFSSKKSVLIDSGKIETSEGTQRYAEYFDTGLTTSSVVYKHLLMPVGEYMPYLFQALAYQFGESSSVAEMKNKRSFTSSASLRPTTIHEVAVATLFCNEVWSPFLYSSQANEGAVLFFNLASHNWYRGSHAIHTQVLRAAKLRAVESSRPLVIANDMSPSVVLSSHGKIMAQTPWGREGVITLSVTPETTTTPYSLLRGWLLLAPLALLALGFVKTKNGEEN